MSSIPLDLAALYVTGSVLFTTVAVALLYGLGSAVGRILFAPRPSELASTSS